VATKLNKRSVS